MAYEDFNLNESAMEEMAKQFAQTKAMQNQEQQEEELDETEGLIYDVFSAFKIFEKMLFLSKTRTKNEGLISFVNNNQSLVDEAFQEFLKLSNDFMTSDVDFEMPNSDEEVIKMIRNILSSILVNLSQFQNENGEIIKKLIRIISQILKNSLNI